MEPAHWRHPAHGSVIIRDQIPLQKAKLAQCLVGVTVADWLKLLNSKVFLWLSEHRVRGLLGARAYRNRAHEVITVDTASLVADHEDRVSLAPINSGATIFDNRRRGAETFLPIAEYPFDEWRRRRSARDAIAELAVNYAVPDVLEHTLAVQVRQGNDVLETLWARGS